MIKSVLSKTPRTTTSYPCFKRYSRGSEKDNIIVLFTAIDTGMCLVDTISPREVGNFKDSWNESAFDVYLGTLTLENNFD